MLLLPCKYEHIFFCIPFCNSLLRFSIEVTNLFSEIAQCNFHYYLLPLTSITHRSCISFIYACCFFCRISFNPSYKYLISRLHTWNQVGLATNSRLNFWAADCQLARSLYLQESMIALVLDGFFILLDVESHFDPSIHNEKDSKESLKEFFFKRVHNY